MATYSPTAVKLKDGTRCVIRSASVEDACRLIAYMQTVFRDGEGMVVEPDEAVRTEVEEREYIQDFIDAPNDILLVAEVDGHIVGNLDIHAGKRRRHAHTCVLGIALHPNWRSRGLGTALFNAVMEWIKTRPQLEKVTLKVLSNNARAIALYKKFGFVEEGRSMRSVKVDANTYFDDVLMARFVNVPDSNRQK